MQIWKKNKQLCMSVWQIANTADFPNYMYFSLCYNKAMMAFCKDTGKCCHTMHWITLQSHRKKPFSLSPRASGHNTHRVFECYVTDQHYTDISHSSKLNNNTTNHSNNTARTFVQHCWCFRKDPITNHQNFCMITITSNLITWLIKWQVLMKNHNISFYC